MEKATQSTKTFSYDARVIQIHLLPPELLGFIRREKYNPVYTISSEGSSYIFLTNRHDFEYDRQNFIDTNNSTNKLRCSIMRGAQFDTICKKGWIFDSYTYIKGSLRYGGFEEYALK
jgi:hypothetical protein